MGVTKPLKPPAFPRGIVESPCLKGQLKKKIRPQQQEPSYPPAICTGNGGLDSSRTSRLSGHKPGYSQRWFVRKIQTNQGHQPRSRYFS